MENETSARFLLRLNGYEIGDEPSQIGWRSHRLFKPPMPNVGNYWFETCQQALKFYKEYDPNLRYE